MKAKTLVSKQLLNIKFNFNFKGNAKFWFYILLLSGSKYSTLWHDINRKNTWFQANENVYQELVCGYFNIHIHGTLEWGMQNITNILCLAQYHYRKSNSRLVFVINNSLMNHTMNMITFVKRGMSEEWDKEQGRDRADHLDLTKHVTKWRWQ